MYQDLRIKLDSSVRSLSRTVCYHLSGTIENGVGFTGNKDIVIYSDHIDFGQCNYECRKRNEEYANSYLSFFGIPGNLAPYFFYNRDGKVTYQLHHPFEYDWSSKRLGYDDSDPLAPTAPDNEEIFSLLYPRFA